MSGTFTFSHVEPDATAEWAGRPIDFTGFSRIVFERDGEKIVLYSGQDDFIDDRLAWWMQTPELFGFKGVELVVERLAIVGGQSCWVSHHGYARDGRRVKFYGGGVRHDD